MCLIFYPSVFLLIMCFPHIIALFFSVLLPYTKVVMFLIFGISQPSSFIAIQEDINEKMRMLGGWEYGLMSKKPALRTQGFGFGFPVPI